MKIFDPDSLPPPLRPLSAPTLAFCIACVLIALALVDLCAAEVCK